MSWDILGNSVIAYIDDILIYSPSSETRLLHVLEKVLQNQLYVKGEKYKFCVCKISFFGYIISPEGVTIVQTKVSAVTEWHRPKTF